MDKIGRRDMVASLAALGLAGAVRGSAAEEEGQTVGLRRDVQMQFMRPEQLEETGRRFPVAYVPFGLIEWHGKHLPLGNDAIKAHAILVRCAEQFGGVVYPPVYFHAGFDQQHLVPVLTQLFDGLKRTGYRVIIGVSGHNIREQLDMIEAGLKPVTADGTCVGWASWEFQPGLSADSASDHAAKWETSNMMYFYPDLVDMSRLGEGPLAPDMKPPDGIGGLDPREHASAEVGRRNVEICAEAIGKKARELLESLPEDQRSFNIEAIIPGRWWLI